MWLARAIDSSTCIGYCTRDVTAELGLVGGLGLPPDRARGWMLLRTADPAVISQQGGLEIQVCCKAAAGAAAGQLSEAVVRQLELELADQAQHMR